MALRSHVLTACIAAATACLIVTAAWAHPQSAEAATVTTIVSTPGKIKRVRVKGDYVAWMEQPDNNSCIKLLRMYRISTSQQRQVGGCQGGDNSSVGATWTAEVKLALQHDGQVFWSRIDGGNITDVNVRASSFAGNKSTSTLYSLSHDTGSNMGVHLSGLDADGTIGVFSVWNRLHLNVFGCMADGDDSDCPVAVGGSLHRINSNLVWGDTGELTSLTVDSGYVQMTRTPGIGLERFGPGLGSLPTLAVGNIAAQAHGDYHAVVLRRPTPSTAVLVAYPDNGGPSVSRSISPTVANEIAFDGARIIFRDGTDIRSWVLGDVSTHHVATAASTPIGLATDGARIVWAENVSGTGRVRTVTLPAINAV